MPTQTVTITPPTSLSAVEVKNHIGSLLPAAVHAHVDEADADGGRVLQSLDLAADGTVTMVTEWSDLAAQEYKTLMADVTPTVKQQLADDGWTITFSPETADL